ncbi:MAG: hypothetical protein ABF289_03605 [Clostridiales bacterium]
MEKIHKENFITPAKVDFAFKLVFGNDKNKDFNFYFKNTKE